MELDNDSVDELNATIIARDATPVLEMEQLPVHYRNKIIQTIQDSDIKKAKFGPRGRSPSPKPYFTIDKTDFPECCRQPWAEAKSLTGKVAFLSVLVNLLILLTSHFKILAKTSQKPHIEQIS